MKVFGTRENLKYYDRPGAYIIPILGNQVAVVKVPKGYFLLGGAIEKGETEEQCIKRECLEEIGYAVELGSKIGSAESFSIHAALGPFHPIQHYYLGRLVEKITDPIETNHTLVWFPYEEIKGKMFSPMQNWALDQAFSFSAV